MRNHIKVPDVQYFHYYTPEEFMSYASAELNWLKDEL